MEIDKFTIKIRLCPDDETMAAILKLLNLWQDATQAQVVSFPAVRCRGLQTGRNAVHVVFVQPGRYLVARQNAQLAHRSSAGYLLPDCGIQSTQLSCAG